MFREDRSATWREAARAATDSNDLNGRLTGPRSVPLGFASKSDPCNYHNINVDDSDDPMYADLHTV